MVGRYGGSFNMDVSLETGVVLHMLNKYKIIIVMLLIFPVAPCSPLDIPLVGCLNTKRGDICEDLDCMVGWEHGENWTIPTCDLDGVWIWPDGVMAQCNGERISCFQLISRTVE